MRILLTGGAGYIGSLLSPHLDAQGHDVTVLDSFFYGHETLPRSGTINRVEVDIQDTEKVDEVLNLGFDVVVHLAAISNDPSARLDPTLTRSINHDAVKHLMRSSKAHGVRRFLYASSASVYGIKDVDDVTEDLSLNPLTDYAQFKAKGEELLASLVDENFVGVSVRAATVCGYSPRLRLDLTVNILTMHALTNQRIRVFGGSQMRPNIHVLDLVDFYTLLTEAPSDAINGEAFNVSYRNESVMGLAEMIRDELSDDVDIEVVPTDDLRSYHLSAAKAERVLDFRPKRNLRTAVRELQSALTEGRIPEADSTWYRNVKHMNRFPDAFPFPPAGFIAPIDHE